MKALTRWKTSSRAEQWWNSPANTQPSSSASVVLSGKPITFLSPNRVRDERMRREEEGGGTEQDHATLRSNSSLRNQEAHRWSEKIKQRLEFGREGKKEAEWNGGESPPPSTTGKGWQRKKFFYYFFPKIPFRPKLFYHFKWCKQATSLTLSWLGGNVAIVFWYLIWR